VRKSISAETPFAAAARATLVGVLIAVGCVEERPPLDSSRDGAACVCPQATDVTLSLPPDVMGPKVTVSAASCTAKYDEKNDEIVVSGYGATSFACIINVGTPGGLAYSGEVTFQYAGRDCGWRATGVALPIQLPPPPCPRVDINNYNLNLPVPSEFAGSVWDVTTDSSCAASYDAATNSVIVPGGGGAPTCTIIVSLDGGAALSAVASFPTHLRNSCNGKVYDDYYATDPLAFTPFEYVDGGAPPCSR
jgi:hypothetical protein